MNVSNPQVHPEYGELTAISDNDDYAAAAAAEVRNDPTAHHYAVGGSDDEGSTAVEYAIEPERGACARGVTDELASAIEDLPDYRDGAAIITRTVTYGPWRHVTPEEIKES